MTGATSGIGHAVAERLAAADHMVVAIGRNHARSAGGESSRNHERVVAVEADLSDSETAFNLPERVTPHLEAGGLDAIVNSAGYSHPGPIEELEASELRRQFEVNVFAVLAVTQAFLPLLRRGAGRVINVGSPMGRGAVPLHSAYNASKAALRIINDAMRIELGPTGIDVILIEPSTIRTHFADSALASLRRYDAQGSPYHPAIKNAERLYERMYAQSPGPERVADVIVDAVCSDRPAVGYIGTRSRLRWAVLNALPRRLSDAIKRRASGYELELDAVTAITR